MAVVAVVAASDVGGMLARRGDTIMAATATTQYLGVIDGYYWLP